eukprot:jgi/Mesvir1/20704/Mv14902-RA.1
MLAASILSSPQGLEKACIGTGILTLQNRHLKKLSEWRAGVYTAILVVDADGRRDDPLLWNWRELCLHFVKLPSYRNFLLVYSSDRQRAWLIKEEEIDRFRNVPLSENNAIQPLHLTAPCFSKNRIETANWAEKLYCITKRDKKKETNAIPAKEDRPAKAHNLACHKCRKESKGPRQVCSLCKVAVYCCKRHQESDWKRHKAVCPFLKAETEGGLALQIGTFDTQQGTGHGLLQRHSRVTWKTYAISQASHADQFSAHLAAASGTPAPTPVRNPSSVLQLLHEL